MKANYEVITVASGESWSFFRRDAQLQLPFNWHYHPEYELSLVLNARGTRYIGDHIEHIAGHDLVLTGPNLPHTWTVTPLEGEAAIDVRVIWFTPDWLNKMCEVCPELIPLRQSLVLAQQGLLYDAATLHRVRPVMENMIDAEPMQRLVLLFEVLQILAAAQATQLSSIAFSSDGGARSQQRIQRVTQFLTENYNQSVDLDALAKLANLSVNSLCRTFKQHTRMTISEYLTQLRIGRVCEALIAGSEPISVIAYRAGYSHLAHFNRQFKQIKQLSPSEYRAKFHRS